MVYQTSLAFRCPGQGLRGPFLLPGDFEYNNGSVVTTMITMDSESR